jgi:hypothetical protein
MTVDYILSGENRYFMHLGDWLEAIVTDDKRYNAPPDDLKEKEQVIPMKQAMDAVGLFKWRKCTVPEREYNCIKSGFG